MSTLRQKGFFLSSHPSLSAIFSVKMQLVAMLARQTFCVSHYNLPYGHLHAADVYMCFWKVIKTLGNVTDQKEQTDQSKNTVEWTSSITKTCSSGCNTLRKNNWTAFSGTFTLKITKHYTQWDVKMDWIENILDYLYDSGVISSKCLSSDLLIDQCD